MLKICPLLARTPARRGLHHSSVVNCVIDDALPQFMPDINQMLPQFIDIMNFRLVDPLLHYFPNVVVNWVQYGLLGAGYLVK